MWEDLLGFVPLPSRGLVVRDVMSQSMSSKTNTRHTHQYRTPGKTGLKIPTRIQNHILPLTASFCCVKSPNILAFTYTIDSKTWITFVLE